MIYCQKVERLRPILAVPLLKWNGSGRPTQIGSDAYGLKLESSKFCVLAGNVKIAFGRLIVPERGVARAS